MSARNSYFVKGLVSAFNVNLGAALKDSAVVLEMPFTTIPELKPGQSVVVPVKVTLLHASPCHIETIVHSARYVCASGVEGKCVIQEVVFKVGLGAECVAGGFVGLADQAIGFITGTPPAAPCTCAMMMSGSDADLIRRGQSKGYSVKVKSSNCPCRLLCEIGTVWSAEGDLQISGSNTGCSVTVTSPQGAGGRLKVNKGGFAQCKEGSRQISGCDVSAINVPLPDYRETFINGAPIAITVEASPDGQCPLDLEAELTKNIGGLSVSGNAVTFTPGDVADTATLIIRDRLKPSLDAIRITIIVQALPTVEISSVDPRPVTCVGKPITIKARGLPERPQGGGSYEWFEGASLRPETGDTLIVNSNTAANDKRISVTYKANGQQSAPASALISFARVKTLGLVPFRDSFTPTYFVGEDLTITSTASNANLPGAEMAIIVPAGIPHTPKTDLSADGQRVKTIHLTGTARLENVEARCGSEDVGISVTINVDPTSP